MNTDKRCPKCFLPVHPIYCGEHGLLGVEPRASRKLRADELSTLLSEVAYSGCLSCREQRALLHATLRDVDAVGDDGLLAECVSSFTYESMSCSDGARYRAGGYNREEVGARLEEYPEKLLRQLEELGLS